MRNFRTALLSAGWAAMPNPMCDNILYPVLDGE
jgi:hypothetical protein